MPRQIIFLVAGTCLPALFLCFACAVKAMRRFGMMGLWLCGWGLIRAQMKQVFVMLHPSAAEEERVERTGAVHPADDADGSDPFTPYRLRV